VEVFIAVFDEKNRIYCEISDGRFILPKTNIKIKTGDKKRIGLDIYDYLRINHNIEIFISTPKKCYRVGNSIIIAIEKDNWKKKEYCNNLGSKDFINLCEFVKLCDLGVVKGGWGSEECQLVLGAYCLQESNKKLKSWSFAKLISLVTLPEKNLSTI